MLVPKPLIYTNSHCVIGVIGYFYVIQRGQTKPIFENKNKTTVGTSTLAISFPEKGCPPGAVVGTFKIHTKARILCDATDLLHVQPHMYSMDHLR